MEDAAARFFERLDRLRGEPLLRKVRGTVRIDVRQGPSTEHWMVRFDRGDVTVSRDDGPADSVVTTDPELFEQIVGGEENGIAAMLRGAMQVAGDLRLVLTLERLFPGPPDSRGRGRGPCGRGAVTEGAGPR
ncbi:SCP2 sterol-binding domain-containing protein [Micromonospora zhanjiangensis]|uniref:SCP2 sterol-binding domain-containing protein n=1 Tax=Micromonospora zhanjiangensis TaxID=1522057 RepID=A0ABV8KLX6_9ACTN